MAPTCTTAVCSFCPSNVGCAHAIHSLRDDASSTAHTHSRACHARHTSWTPPLRSCVRFLAGGSGKRLLREREQERRRDRESEHGAERAAWGAVAKVLGGVGQHASMRHSIVYDSTVDHQVQLALDIALNPQP